MATVTVVTNIAKETMISAVSGTDIAIALISAASWIGGWNAEQFRTFENWSEVSAYECGANGSYSAGGAVLSGLSAYHSDFPYNPNAAWFDGSSLTWPNVSLSASAMVIYRTSSGMLIEFLFFDNYQIAGNGPFTVNWNSGHILKMIG